MNGAGDRRLPSTGAATATVAAAGCRLLHRPPPSELLEAFLPVGAFGRIWRRDVGEDVRYFDLGIGFLRRRSLRFFCFSFSVRETEEEKEVLGSSYFVDGFGLQPKFNIFFPNLNFILVLCYIFLKISPPAAATRSTIPTPFSSTRRSPVNSPNPRRPPPPPPPSSPPPPPSSPPFSTLPLPFPSTHFPISPPSSWPSISNHNNKSLPSPAAAANQISPSSAAAHHQYLPSPPHAPEPNGRDQNSRVIRNSKKRSRASRRAPTTVLTTDTSNFRAMVQEFTGIPAPPFSSSPFPRTRFDLFGSSTAAPHQPPYLRRPFPQKLIIPPTQQQSPLLPLPPASYNNNSSSSLFAGGGAQHSSLLSSLLQSSSPKYPRDPLQIPSTAPPPKVNDDFISADLAGGLPGLVSSEHGQLAADPGSWRGPPGVSDDQLRAITGDQHRRRSSNGGEPSDNGETNFRASNFNGGDKEPNNEGQYGQRGSFYKLPEVLPKEWPGSRTQTVHRHSRRSTVTVVTVGMAEGTVHRP
ncbi:hypothetical protein DM860_014107 [Cuscuta australis]|uniref:VQ domain-containing protein n=1 Tax=Cuscuta australis TaxID=267555 RepID=A0A328DFB4_9ASTE|nr:hypothetical protein DM860_014107 [Cuscuta australis]